MTNPTPDVLIVGAGMAGLALAAALADSALSVVILEPHPAQEPARWAQGFDPRVSALTQASEQILRNIGVWDSMLAQRVAPFAMMEVWDGDGTGAIQFDGHQAGVDHLGHIVENRVTTHALLERVQQADNIQIETAGLIRIIESGLGWTIEDSEQRLWQPALLVGADGGRSRVRDQLGFRCRSWPYQQQAIVTTVETEFSHGDAARQVFLESGPLAFLPLRQVSNEMDGHYSSIVWTLDEDATQTLMSMDADTFKQHLQRTFESRLGAIKSLDQRYCFPLQQNHAVDYIMPGVVLIGDAAHTIHPLAGQGINLGFLDAAVLAEELLQAQSRGLALNDFTLLRRYQRQRKTHNLLMMSTMEFFRRVYGWESPTLRIARNFGMSFCNRHVLLKNKIMAYAMGLEGDLPALAQPGLVADF